MNAPATLEGWQAWQVIEASAGQLRTVGAVVMGFDAGAVLALGASLGACLTMLAEVFAAAEAVAIAKINERLRS